MNPYWETIRPYVYADERPWGTELQAEPMRLPDGSYRTDLKKNFAEYEKVCRHTLVKKYSWTIPDPATVAFVLRWVDRPIFDPLAGTGYWAYLLENLGVDIIAADKAPGTNPWHDGADLWFPILLSDGVKTARLFSHRTMLLSWPPYAEPIGEKVIRAYQGNRIIYIGESEHGCCGDDAMWDRLNRFWTEVAWHRPVQWFGMHDYVTIYERRALT